jgi:ankyrin repeat protein
MLWAAGGGHLPVCRYLAEECGVDARFDAQQSRRSYRGRTALHWAARNGRLRVLRWLVEERGADVDATTHDGTSAFDWAAWQGHLDCMKYLKARGCAVVGRANDHGCNAVMWCVQGAGGVECCRYLHGLGCAFDLVNRNGHSSVHKAAQRGKLDVCRWLLEGGELRGRITRERHLAPDGEGFTPSALAAVEGHDEVAAWLARAEAGRGNAEEAEPAAEEGDGGRGETRKGGEGTRFLCVAQEPADGSGGVGGFAKAPRCR